MSRTLVIPDELYEQMAEEARTQGLDTVEDLLASRFATLDQASRRRSVSRARTLRQSLRIKYGVFKDSTPLLREDRRR